ncbi:MAG TPA: hypothetical protein VJG90_07150 [Candidatus Nanoarchaeia archaeon]|nr:hypothetical protein [Candidatus Nanoarchaeia archaeon]
MRFEEEWLVHIRKKKGLEGLGVSFTARLLKECLQNNHSVQDKMAKSHTWAEFERSAECKAITKEVRSRLREVYGVFWEHSKQDKLLQALLQNPTPEAHNKVLALHTSTKERLPFYEEVYKKIFAITGKPKKILDLACGLNPFSYPYLGCSPEYLASELCESDAAFLQAFFDGLNIQGQAFAFDLLQFNKTECTDFIKSDVCFLFKALDSLEAIDWGFSETLLPNLPATWLVVSFSTRSLGGKKEIKKEKRKWFERILEKNHWTYKTFEVANECFYVIKKN